MTVFTNSCQDLFQGTKDFKDRCREARDLKTTDVSNKKRHHNVSLFSIDMFYYVESVLLSEHVSQGFRL